MKYRFSGFTVDTNARELTRDGQIVELQPRTWELLLFLISHNDRAVSKDELQDEVWQTIVSESAVSRSVMKLRKALGDSDESIIKTVPRFGYRFVAADFETDADSAVEPGPLDFPEAQGAQRKTPFLALALAVLALLGVGYLLLTGSPQNSEADSAPDNSIAVLPFVAMSAGENDEFFADGLTEEILNVLAQVPDLLVTARTSSFFFKNKDLPVQEIAQTLGVKHVVEGSVRRELGQVRITVQLIRASDGFHVWSNSYDRPVANVFEVQTDIAESIAAALDVVLDDAQRTRMLQAGLRDVEAFVPFQKGVDLYNAAHGHHDRDGMLGQANEYFEQVLAINPEVGRAYEYHADRYLHYIVGAAHNVGGFDYSEAKLLEASRVLESDLSKAKEFASDEAAAQGAALTLAFVTGEWRGIRGRLKQLADESPCDLNSWFSTVAEPFGMALEASRVFEYERECNPMNWVGWQDGAHSLIWQGRSDEAVNIALQGMEYEPNNSVKEAALLAFIAAGRFDDANEFIANNEYDARRNLRLHYSIAAAQGDGDRAKDLLDEYFADPGAGAHLYLAYIAQLGDRDAANALAAEIDARPYGYLSLTTNLYFCFCGAAFDLEVAPNFAARIEEAGFSWPPPSPIDWPLKGW